jgi:hypothetical protein
MGRIVRETRAWVRLSHIWKESAIDAYTSNGLEVLGMAFYSLRIENLGINLQLSYSLSTMQQKR